MSTTKFASADLTVGQLNAIVKKMGGYEGALRFLRGETLVVEKETLVGGSAKKCPEDDIVYLPVTSIGRTGEEWVQLFNQQKINVHEKTIELLRSKEFKPTAGITSSIAIMRGKSWTDEDRFTLKICAHALTNSFSLPNLEIACLIREALSFQDIIAMGLCELVVIESPDSLSTHNLFSFIRYSSLSAYRLYHFFDFSLAEAYRHSHAPVSVVEFAKKCIDQDFKFHDSTGFVFVASQTSKL